jgi:hypothetical protein
MNIDRSLIQTEEQMLARWGDYETPVVSINCVTYNHEPYIRDALDGFLIQQTDFPFEILIHDDASTDGTADIIRGYEKRYPHIIKPIYQIDNQYSQGNKPGIINRKRARGKYIAMCEGDDYWTDSFKLQKQVDFLERTPSYSLCFCNVNVVYDDQAKQSHPGYMNRKMPTQYLRTIRIPRRSSGLRTLAKGNYIHTPGVLFRNWIREHGLPPYLLSTPIGDWPLHLRTASFGQCRYFPETMAVYRVREGGVWSSQRSSEQQRMVLLQYPPLLTSPLFPDSIKKIWYRNLPRMIAQIEATASGDARSAMLEEVKEKLTEAWPSFPLSLPKARAWVRRKKRLQRTKDAFRRVSTRVLLFTRKVPGAIAHRIGVL